MIYIHWHFIKIIIPKKILDSRTPNSQSKNLMPMCQTLQSVADGIHRWNYQMKHHTFIWTIELVNKNDCSLKTKCNDTLWYIKLTQYAIEIVDFWTFLILNPFSFQI